MNGIVLQKTAETAHSVYDLYDDPSCKVDTGATALQRAAEAVHCAYILYGDLPREDWMVIAADAARIAKFSSWSIEGIVCAAARAHERRPRSLEGEDEEFVLQLLRRDPETVGEEAEQNSENTSDSASEPDPFA